MISETDAAYIAGLFDGEGSIQYKQYDRQRKNNGVGDVNLEMLIMSVY